MKKFLPFNRDIKLGNGNKLSLVAGLLHNYMTISGRFKSKRQVFFSYAHYQKTGSDPIQHSQGNQGVGTLEIEIS